MEKIEEIQQRIQQNKEEMTVVKFIIDNMEKIIKNGLNITDVTEDPTRHPHYSSRVVTELYYHEDGYLVHRESRSGSPDAWAYYENDYPVTISEIAKWIVDDINASKALEEEENMDIYYIKIEGM